MTQISVHREGDRAGLAVLDAARLQAHRDGRSLRKSRWVIGRVVLDVSAAPGAT